MSDRIPSIADITDWLIKNPQKTNGRGRKLPTGVPDAVKALGYKGPPLKIREGNLTNGRENLRISLKGQSNRSDYFRAKAQARTTPDKSVRAGANRKINGINGQSSTVNTADHILSNGALANGEEFVRATRGEEGVRQMRERYKQAGVGYGHSKENIQGLTKKQNGIKEVQERTLRGNGKNKTAYLQHLENKPPVTSPEFPAWQQKKSAFVNKIDSANLPDQYVFDQLKRSRGFTKGLNVMAKAGTAFAVVAAVDAVSRGASANELGGMAVDSVNPIDGGALADGTLQGQKYREMMANPKQNFPTTQSNGTY